jgi:hypothetical protein
MSQLLKITFLIAIILSFQLQTLALKPDNHAHREEVLKSITSEELMSYVYELTEPKYKGRLAGSPEYMNVASWVASQLESWGIEPLGDNGSYFQYFDWPYTEVLSKGEVNLFRDGETISLSAPDDYYPGANSANGSITAEVVFAGYGISAPHLGYDDFASINVDGKIVMIAGGTPYTGSNVDTLNLWGPYSSGSHKMENAYKQGARGVLYLDKLASPGTPYFPDFYYAHIDNSITEKILGQPLSELLSVIREEFTAASFQTDFTAQITSETLHHEKGTTANVIGYIPGHDPGLTDEAIILGAHLDGQGYLGFHFPGALDNASGVADVMAVARALSAFNGQMKRSVVFILFGAEEVGLVGSTIYCQNPAFPPEKTLLFMNLDMVGNGEGLALWHGESYPEILEHFRINNEKYLGRSLRANEGRMPVGRPRTDGLVFMQHGFRTFHVSTTDRVNPSWYHDPRDVPENLTSEIMRDVSALLFLGVLDLANDESLVHEEMFLIQ